MEVADGEEEILAGDVEVRGVDARDGGGQGLESVAADVAIGCYRPTQATLVPPGSFSTEGQKKDTERNR